MRRRFRGKLGRCDDSIGYRDAKMRTYKLVQSSTQQTAFVKFQINYLLKQTKKTYG